MEFYDFHLHLYDCSLECKEELYSMNEEKKYTVVSCAHSEKEFLVQNELAESLSDISVVQSFGIHPLFPDKTLADFMEELLVSKKISAIGECGFDFFTEEGKHNEKAQEECFDLCVCLAREYKVPLIIHNRKALHKIFENEKKLKDIPNILFHGFYFSFQEAVSILRHLEQSYFSFGKTLLQNGKKSLDCIKNLPLEKVCLETDSPFMTLKNEAFTSPGQIETVYKKFCELKNISLEELQSKMKENFYKIFTMS